MTRLEEVLVKEKRLKKMMEAKGLDGILLIPDAVLVPGDESDKHISPRRRMCPWRS